MPVIRRWGSAGVATWLMMLLVLPWLLPFSPGPTPAMVPILFAWICSSILLVSLCLPGVRCTSPANVAPLVTRAWRFAALCSAAIALLQYFGWAGLWTPWINVAPPGEAFANLRQRNLFASLANIGMVSLWLAAAVGSQYDGRDDAPPAPVRANGLLLPLSGVVLLSFGLAASSSRTGMLELFMLTGLALVWRWQHRPRLGPLIPASLFAYALAVVCLPILAGFDPAKRGLLARLSGPDDACEGRTVLWSNVWHLVTLRPWSGWGWGGLDYAHFITLYPVPRFCDILDNAHNLPLHLAVELGIPAAVAACGVVTWLLWRARPWHETRPDRQLAWAVLALIGLHSMLEYPLWYGPFQIATASCLWILWRPPAPGGVVPPSPSDAEQRPAAARPWAAHVRHGFGALALLVLLGLAYAAWDYHRVSQLYTPVGQRTAAYRENTLDKVRGSWLFRKQVRFAELTTTEVTDTNAQRMYTMALELLHFSPEPRVVEKLIAAARRLGLADEAQFFATRYQAAFPAEFKAWLERAADGRPRPAARVVP